MLSITLITPPVVEPVTLEEAKAWLKLDLGDEDAILTRLITTARQMVEHYTSRALVAQTWRLVIARPSALPFVWLPKAPARTLVAASLQAQGGAQTALDLSLFKLECDSEPPRLVWGSIGDGSGMLSVDVVFGYGEGADNVPAALKQAVLVLVAQAYEQRGVVDTPALNPALALLAPFKLRRLR